MSSKSGLLGLLRAKWNPPAPPTTSFERKTVLITGSNTGLGFYAAQHFARLGAEHLILGVRNISKGEAARKKLMKRANGTRIDVLALDMDNYTSVTRFVGRLKTEYPRIDIAVLNAGIYNMQYRTSTQGWEETLQVNTLSTTLLAILLLPILQHTKQLDSSSTPHLVLVSSGRHAAISASSIPTPPAPILSSFNSPPIPTTPYDASQQYQISKLLLMYTLKPLAFLATTSGGEAKVIVTSCCPGLCASDLSRGVPWYLIWAAWLFFKIFGRTTEEGSRTLVSACSHGEEAQGGYWKDDELRRPGEMVTSKEGRRAGEQVWREVVDVLRKEVPGPVPELEELIEEEGQA
ncbi:hypothetical protein N7G274_000877 [Stereocaulon virgatum]|uniref:NAD(P)-binding protein n=1 Tax=Stereocaulon virgatum TaxID=373712 RepID=A0ABR4AM93_9LECA